MQMIWKNNSNLCFLYYLAYLHPEIIPKIAFELQHSLQNRSKHRVLTLGEIR